MQPQYEIVIEDYATVRDDNDELESLITRHNRQYLLSELNDTSQKATYMLDLASYARELEAENAALKVAADSVLADAITHGYEPGDCPDWFDGMISCDSLRKLWLIFYPEDGDE